MEGIDRFDEFIMHTLSNKEYLGYKHTDVDVLLIDKSFQSGTF